MFRFKFQTADTRPHSRGTICPSFAFRFPSNRREQGMPDARCTRGLVCKMHERKRTRAYRFSGGYPTFPAQWLYGLLRALPGESGFVVSVALRNLAPSPGRARAPPQDLTPTTEASGPHDFAVRISIVRPARRCPLTENPPCEHTSRPTPPRPPHPIPTFGDDGQRPFLRDRMA
jgi:hypothetical protein